MGEEDPDFGNEDKTGVDATTSIEDGQDASGLLAKVETKVTGENAMHVITGESTSPNQGVIYCVHRLVDGSSPDMNVNGSVTPVVFEVGPPAGQIWFVRQLSIYLQDGGNLNANNFGSLAELTNGLLIEQQIDSVDYPVETVLNNLDLTLTFLNGSIVGSSNGWLNTNKNFAGNLTFTPGVTLRGDDGDVIKTTVQDNLSGLDFLRMSFLSNRVL